MQEEINPYAPRRRWVYSTHNSSEVRGEVIATCQEEAVVWFAQRKGLPVETFIYIYRVYSPTLENSQHENSPLD